MQSFKLSIALFISIVTSIGLVACGARSELAVVSDSRPAENTAAVREAKPGHLAPEFEVTKLDGSTVSFADIEGNPAVLIFWTAWCPSCKEEAPVLNKLAEKYDGKGIRVLGINIGEGEARVKEGIKDFGIKYDVARDADSSVAKRFGVIGTPTIVFLDKDGITQFVGNELPADYAAQLDGLVTAN
jgi:peroxiredoxin